jgi:beta-galactosidase
MDFPFLYGAQYYRDPTPERRYWAEDLRLMAVSGFNAVKFWAQWRWAHREPERLQFDELDVLMDLAAEQGLGVTINVIFDVAPTWLYERYPDALMVKADGSPIFPYACACRQIGGCPGPCFNHAAAREARRTFLEALVSRYAHHPAMQMWDVWNEPEQVGTMYRMPKPETLTCYCPLCHARFVTWLQARYRTLEGLNAVWGRCYTRWDDVELPQSPQTFTDMVDWRLFMLDTLAEEARWRIALTKAIDAQHPVYLHPACSTLSGFNPVTGIDDFLMAEGCDCFGGTTGGVPFSTVQCLSSAQGRVCYNVESHLRAGSTNMYPRHLTVREFTDNFVPQIGLGIRGFLHWQFRAETLGLEAPGWGLLDVDGSQGDTFRGAVEFWQRVAPAAERLAALQPEQAEAAIVRSTPNEILHWCMHQDFSELRESLAGYTTLLYDKNVRFQFLDDRQVTMGVPGHIKLLIVPALYGMTAPVANALATWVRQGGTLWCEAHTGGYNLTSGRHETTLPGLGLAEAFGLREVQATAVNHLGISQPEALTNALPADVLTAMRRYHADVGGPTISLQVGGVPLYGRGRYTEMHGEDMEALAALPGHAPCIVRKQIGRGCVYYLGIHAGSMCKDGGNPGLDRLLEIAMSSASIPATAERWSGVPDGVRIDRLVTPQGDALTLFNRLSSSVDLELETAMPLSGLFTAQWHCRDSALCIHLEPGQAELCVPQAWLDAWRVTELTTQPAAQTAAGSAASILR